MKAVNITRLIASGLALVVLAGCSHSEPTSISAPEKPLSTAEENLLKQIEGTPSGDRAAFVGNHRSEIMQFSAGNKTFGDRLNKLMGVDSSGGK